MRLTASEREALAEELLVSIDDNEREAIDRAWLEKSAGAMRNCYRARQPQDRLPKCWNGSGAAARISCPSCVGATGERTLPRSYSSDVCGTWSGGVRICRSGGLFTKTMITKVVVVTERTSPIKLNTFAHRTCVQFAITAGIETTNPTIGTGPITRAITARDFRSIAAGGR